MIVDVFDGVFQIESQTPRPALVCANLRLRGNQFGLGRIDGGLSDVDLHLVRLLVELDQYVALTYPIVVVDQHAYNVA